MSRRALVALAAAHAVCCTAVAGQQECARIVDAAEIRPFFEAAATSRVDVVMIGDSNQAFGGHGWDHGWHKALADRYGLFATGLLTPGENGGNGAGLGYRYQGNSTSNLGGVQYSGAEPYFNNFMSPNVFMAPSNYLYVPEGSVFGGLSGVGMSVQRIGPIDLNAPLRFSLVRAQFAGAPEDPGVFQLAFRRATIPFDSFGSDAAVSTRGASDAIAITQWDIPAAARNADCEFRLTPREVDIVGPFIGYYMRLEDRSKSHGASVTSLYAKGGQSARDMAEALLATHDSYLRLFFERIIAGQGVPAGEARVLVRINSALNDLNETFPSLGWNSQHIGNSPAAFEDNLRAIMDRLRTMWVATGGSTDRIWFLLAPSHPISEPDYPPLVALRDAAIQLALDTSQCAATRFTSLTSATEMNARFWYNFSGFDPNHLTLLGFEELSKRELEGIVGVSCPGDADGDEQVTFNDVTMVLASYGLCAGRPGSGDADGDFVVSFSDVTAVLANFGLECY